MPKPMQPIDVVRQGQRQGIGMARFRVTREDAQRIKDAERSGGQQAGLVVLLRILYKPKKNA